MSRPTLRWRAAGSYMRGSSTIDNRTQTKSPSSSAPRSSTASSATCAVKRRHKFWVGAFHQVVQGDTATALPSLTRSYALATEAGDRLTQSCAARHLGFASLAAGDTGRACERFEESVLLRREIGFLPGVAAGLVALADLATD